MFQSTHGHDIHLLLFPDLGNFLLWLSLLVITRPYLESCSPHLLQFPLIAGPLLPLGLGQIFALFLQLFNALLLLLLLQGPLLLLALSVFGRKPFIFFSEPLGLLFTSLLFFLSASKFLLLLLDHGQMSRKLLLLAARLSIRGCSRRRGDRWCLFLLFGSLGWFRLRGATDLLLGSLDRLTVLGICKIYGIQVRDSLVPAPSCAAFHAPSSASPSRPW